MKFQNLKTRVQRIIVSNLLSLMDSIDFVAPELLMEKAISEIDVLISDLDEETKRLAAYKNFIRIRQGEEIKKLDALGERLGEAVAANDDTAAQLAISRQMDIELQIPVFKAIMDGCDTDTRELLEYITLLQAKKREMQEELRLFRAEHAEENFSVATRQTMLAQLHEIDSIFISVENEQIRISDMSGTLERRNLRKMAELAASSRRNRIQERLEFIKNQYAEEHQEEDA
jgi:phage shock protein A